MYEGIHMDQDITYLGSKPRDIRRQIIDGVLPKFAKCKQLWFSSFVTDGFDKVCNEVPVDMLYGPPQ